MATAPEQIMEPVAEQPSVQFDLAQLKRLYQEARDNTQNARLDAEMAQDYYDNKQLSPAVLKVLRKRKQPENYNNCIAPAVNGMLGLMEQGQTDPRAFPRNEEDQNASEVATDSLRYSADNSRWPRTKLQASKNYLIGGVAAVIVEIDEKRDPWPRIIRQGEFLYDPHSRDPDFEDARFMGVAKWMYVDSVQALYPEADIDADAIAPTTVTFDDEDKPTSGWTDPKRNRVLVVEMYILKGQWHKVCFYGGAILEQGLSEYLDEDGKPTNPIVAQSCFVDRDNARYGVVKGMIPRQDEVNMSGSRALHLLNSRRVRITDPNGPETDMDLIREEAAKPDGVLPFGVEAADNGDLTQFQFMRMQQAKADIDRMGPSPATLGREGASASGRSHLVRQQAGLTELTVVLSGVEDMELRVYRQMWMRIRQFKTEQWTVRVTDDIGAAKFLTLNEEVAEEIPAIVQGPDGQPMVGTQRVVREVKNRPAEMDMDIIIETSPDTATLAAEQFQEIMKLVPIYGPAAFPLKMVIKASALPKKRELLEALETMEQEAAQQPQQVDPRMEADAANKAAQAKLNAAKADGQELENQMNAIGAAHLIDAVPEIDNNLVAQTG